MFYFEAYAWTSYTVHMVCLDIQEEMFTNELLVGFFSLTKIDTA